MMTVSNLHPSQISPDSAASRVTPSQNSGSYRSGSSKPLSLSFPRAYSPTGETTIPGRSMCAASSRPRASVKVRSRTLRPAWASLIASCRASRVLPVPAPPRTQTRSFSRMLSRAVNCSLSSWIRLASMPFDDLGQAHAQRPALAPQAMKEADPARRGEPPGVLAQGPFQDPGQRLLQVWQVAGPDDEPFEVALGRLGVEIRVREYDRHADRRREQPFFNELAQQDPDEAMGLGERRRFHGLAVLKPGAVFLFDQAPLDLEDQDAAVRVRDDEIGLGELRAPGPDLQRVPGGPAGRQGFFDAPVDRELRLRTVRARLGLGEYP